jgi:hypothetical protein
MLISGIVDDSYIIAGMFDDSYVNCWYVWWLMPFLVWWKLCITGIFDDGDIIDCMFDDWS